jgi:hypothetical protein
VRISLKALKEPALLFGRGEFDVDPKIGLQKGGLLSLDDGSTKAIRIGLVSVDSETSKIFHWLKRLGGWMIDSADNALRFPKFPGSQKAVHCKFEINEIKHVKEIAEGEFQAALKAGSQSERFEKLLDLYSSRIKALFRDGGPSCVVVGFPEEVATLRIANNRLSFQEQRLLQRLQEESNAEQMELFDNFTEEERRAARELLPQAEDLLFRNFHRALKARCMNLHGAVPLQVIRSHTYEPDSSKQNDATKAWNITVALAYKSGEIPWQPAHLAAGVCFVGISFHHLKRRSGDLVYASLAQAYSTDTEPYAIKGESIPRSQRIGKQPYLKPEQAKQIIKRVIEQYHDQTGTVPARIVVHKSSQFMDPEVIGFRECLKEDVSHVDLVSLSPTGLRLLNKGTKEIGRGSFVQVENCRTFLFTSGYVDWWKSYPGPHIPAPLELRRACDEDLEHCAAEILALTKMNWNSAEGLGRTPITISFARQVGTVMTELGEEDEVNPFFRFYM